MTRGARFLLLIALSFLAVGCVAQGEQDRLLRSNRVKDDQIANLKAQLEERDATIAALRAQQAQPSPELLAQIEQLQADRNRLQNELNELLQRVNELPTGPLPAEIDQALVQLAASNPNLMTYDPKLGMIRFASDLTFALGSVEVSSAATTSLRELARILNTPLAQPYEVRVVGHTDNVPIGNPRTRQQHPTNWHLSVHRAISVKDVLEKAGVSANRIGVGGYGEFRPVVANGPRGAQANRRVEIYLVPMPQNTQLAPAPAAPVEPAKPAAPARRAEPEAPEFFK